MNHFARLPYPEYDPDEYQAILDWLETASVDQILGAVSLASGVTRSDLEAGIQSLIETGRSDLARAFSYLVPSRQRLADLASEHSRLANAIRIMMSSTESSNGDAVLTLKGYNMALGQLRELHFSGVITASEREVMMLELEALAALDT